MYLNVVNYLILMLLFLIYVAAEQEYINLDKIVQVGITCLGLLHSRIVKLGRFTDKTIFLIST